MGEFSDKRADRAFLDVGRLVADLRTKHNEYTNSEIAYALLQVCACVDEGPTWWAFLEEALRECINQEVGGWGETHA